MDKDRVKGTVKQATGNAKANLGHLSGDVSREIEGKTKRTGGTLQIAFSKAKDALRKS